MRVCVLIFIESPFVFGIYYVLHLLLEMLPVLRLMRVFSTKLNLAQKQNVDLCKLVIPMIAQLCMTDDEIALLQSTIHFTCKKIARGNPPEDIFSFLDAIKDYVSWRGREREGRERGRKEGRKRGREGGREGGKSRVMCVCIYYIEYQKSNLQDNNVHTSRKRIY